MMEGDVSWALVEMVRSIRNNTEQEYFDWGGGPARRSVIDLQNDAMA